MINMVLGLAISAVVFAGCVAAGNWLGARYDDPWTWWERRRWKD